MLQPQLNMLTLGARDLQVSKAFYSEIVGWEQLPERPKIALFLLNGLALAIVPHENLAKDQNTEARIDEGLSYQNSTCSHFVSTREEVDAIYRRLEDRGARILVPPRAAFWGGYSFTFADPDGHCWRVICHPHWKLEADGRLSLPDY